MELDQSLKEQITLHIPVRKLGSYISMLTAAQIDDLLDRWVITSYERGELNMMDKSGQQIYLDYEQTVIYKQDGKIYRGLYNCSKYDPLKKIHKPNEENTGDYRVQIRLDEVIEFTDRKSKFLSRKVVSNNIFKTKDI